MALTLRVVFSCLVFLLSLSINFASGSRCLYTLKVKTSWDDGSGTNSIVNLRVFDKSGKNLFIERLDAYGIMDPTHNYFERDNLDFFNLAADCLTPCALHVSIDGSGNRPDWHLEYVQITVTGDISTRVDFAVNNWISLGSDSYVNLCLPFA